MWPGRLPQAVTARGPPCGEVDRVIHAPNGLFEFLQGGFQMAQQSLQVRDTAAASDEPEVKAVCAGGQRDIESLVLNEGKALAGQDYSEQWASPALIMDNFHYP
jgi:hypothetical protein